MKAPDRQELKPVYIHEVNYSADDEISLVDLAMVLVRRKRIIVVITTFVILLSVITAFLMPKSYTFATSIEIGSQIIDGTIKPFESPETLLAKIQHAFIPQSLNKQRQTNPENKTKYKITSSIPKSSVIIVLEVKGTEDEADLLKSLLQSINQQAIFDHSRIYNSVRKNITSRLKQTTTDLEILKKTDDNETEIATQQNLIELYSSQLANLRETREILPAMKSIEPTGTSRKLIVIISAFAGIFLGIFSAFFAEFVAKVREISRQNKD
jgi:uncharacterized protein involved in exopolysaccharide biosynthesis